MGAKGYGKASGAGTVINAIATYKGSAFGIDLWTYAEVELGEDFRGIKGEVEIEGEKSADTDTRLIETCVELVLRKFDLPLRGYVKTGSEIPVGSGLKSSSAAANAAVVATLDAIGEKAKEGMGGALDAIRMGVDVAQGVGVSITGAFDDACASLLGGFVVTDNEKKELIKRVEKDFEVFILVPRKKAFTANTDVKRSRLIAPWVDIAYELALEERFEEAMTLNGFLYCAALNFDPEPMVKALECGIKGVSLSGTGPSFVALVDEEKGERLRETWGELGVEGRIIKRKVNNEPSL
uniref:Shikimate kinase n=1 Tax=Candidatus Methanophagaceae archaeon ANME-1 ERB6 TaxID=2759912 RepID=A0A7G9YYJ5_9EURY|nr:shikimate kinase [Methanosarcinales archaeon ANME-1 ERB6]